MTDTMQGVVDAVSSVDPTLAGAAKRTLGKMEHELKTLQGKMIQAAKRRDETLRRQFIRAQVQTFPQGHPQERALGFVLFPESVRSGARRSTVRGTADRSGAALGTRDLNRSQLALPAEAPGAKAGARGSRSLAKD